MTLWEVIAADNKNFLGGSPCSSNSLLVIIIFMLIFNVVFQHCLVLDNKICYYANFIVPFHVYSPQPFSSLLSLQSSLWSHTWLDGTQFPLSHLYLPGGQVGGGVWHKCGSSSDSSPQSLSPSHWKSCEIQRPF